MELKTEQSNRTPGQIAWSKFKNNRLAFAGLFILLVSIAIAILGSNIRPDGSPDANNQILSLAKKPMNFQVQVIEVEKNYEVSHRSFFGRLFFGGSESSSQAIPIETYRIITDSIYLVEYSGFDEESPEELVYSLADVCFSQQGIQYDSTDSVFNISLVDGETIKAQLSEVREMVENDHLRTKRFLLGTDKFGRDVLSRLMAGTIVSLSVGLISVLISLVLGLSLGAAAGYFGGWVDEFITWLINVVWSIPTLLLVIAITFALGKGFVQVFIAVGLTMWVEVARVIRGQVLSLKNLEYVQAAKALGYDDFRIIRKHILPNALGPVIVISAANFASAILLEAGLSFLGIGAQIPMASWGQMINEHYIYITTSRAHLAILPGLFILILVLAFMLIGNGLRDAFDTRAS